MEHVYHMTIPRHKTAIKRKALSLPVRTAIDNGWITNRDTVLDYGCGRGDDVLNLQQRGIDASGYDPHYGPNTAYQADVVILNYVLNVIENPIERAEVLKNAFDYANQRLIVAVRSDKLPKTAKPYGDGVITSTGTFQRTYTVPELVTFVAETLGNVKFDAFALGSSSVVIKIDR